RVRRADPRVVPGDPALHLEAQGIERPRDLEIPVLRREGTRDPRDGGAVLAPAVPPARGLLRDERRGEGALRLVRRPPLLARRPELLRYLVEGPRGEVRAVHHEAHLPVVQVRVRGELAHGSVPAVHHLREGERVRDEASALPPLRELGGGLSPGGDEGSGAEGGGRVHDDAAEEVLAPRREGRVERVLVALPRVVDGVLAREVDAVDDLLRVDVHSAASISSAPIPRRVSNL